MTSVLVVAFYSLTKHQLGKDLAMNINKSLKLPLLVEYTPVGKEPEFGIVTHTNTDGSHVITDLRSRDTIVVQDCSVRLLTHHDFSKVSNGKVIKRVELMVRTKCGKVGELMDIRLVSPYDEETAFLRVGTNRIPMEFQLSQIDAFVGHMGVNPEYLAH